MPLTAARDDAAHLDALHSWMTSYRQAELFDDRGAPQPQIVDWLPRDHLRMSANPHTNGGRFPRDLELPDFRAYAVKAGEVAEATQILGGWLRDVMAANAEHRNFRIMGPLQLGNSVSANRGHIQGHIHQQASLPVVTGAVRAAAAEWRRWAVTATPVGAAGVP